MAGTDIVIAGAGIIGLSLALELDSRGWNVTVVDRGRAMAGASTAAAGMLATADPGNPPALLPLSTFSAALYPAYLQRLHQLSGVEVPFQTSWTVQHNTSGGACRMREHSLDPQNLAAALLGAIASTGIKLREREEMFSSPANSTTLVHATGAWFDRGRVFPRKGQMLRVRLPAGFCLDEVHRGEDAYIVPRTSGDGAGTAVIGATVEDAGFDLTTRNADLASLRAMASAWVPEVASEVDAPTVDSWAGIRPATSDGLPLLGEIAGRGGARCPREFVATGHFRNGILLAPATAQVMADLIEGRQPAVDLRPFSPQR